MENTNPGIPGIYVLIWAFAFILSIWILNLFWLGGAEYAIRGAFGDMFGASNALFSGLALCAIIYGLFVQRAEVKIAREELRQTQNILTEQTELNKSQEIALKSQLFESKLFSILNANQADLSKLTSLTGGGLSGSAAVVQDLHYLIGGKVSEGGQSVWSNVDREAIRKRVLGLFKDYWPELEQYVRGLHLGAEFITRADLHDVDFYKEYFRSRVPHEVQLLLLVCSFAEGRVANFLMRHHWILDDIPDSLLIPALVAHRREIKVSTAESHGPQLSD